MTAEALLQCHWEDYSASQDLSAGLMWSAALRPSEKAWKLLRGGGGVTAGRNVEELDSLQGVEFHRIDRTLTTARRWHASDKDGFQQVSRSAGLCVVFFPNHDRSRANSPPVLGLMRRSSSYSSIIHARTIALQ